MMDVFTSAPVAAKSSAMPAHKGLWPNDHHGLEDRRTSTIRLDEEQAIAVRELDPTAHLALQYNQLLPQSGMLCFKSALGLEERGTVDLPEVGTTDWRNTTMRAPNAV
jgi:hypothetical protein